MLRVEGSNLPKPRGTPRPRRLLPNPPVPRRSETTARHELPPPAGAARQPTSEPPRSERSHAPVRERWSVKLELGDDEIAKLYGQGMTRGAVVWKKGMHEWRPLLITHELSGLLRRTRVSLIESSSPPPPVVTQTSARPSIPPDEPTVPRAAPVPLDLAPPSSEKSPFASVAPTALDVEPSPKPRRRTIELVAVALAAFALAWMVHAKLHPPTEVPTVQSVAAASQAVLAPACEPARAASTFTASTLAGSSIPRVSIADLPLAGAKSGNLSPVHSEGKATRHALARSSGSSSSNEKPSRSALVEALSQVANAASSCGERGGPVRLVVTFASSGVARSIQVSGADLPSATRSCMIGAASRARVPAFTGEPVTVSKTL